MGAPEIVGALLTGAGAGAGAGAGSGAGAGVGSGVTVSAFTLIEKAGRYTVTLPSLTPMTMFE